MKGEEKDLHAKERAFALAFFEEKNGRKAWRKAFPNSKCTGASADSQASRMLNNVKVQQFLDELAREAEKGAIADKRERMEFLTRLLRTPIAEVGPGSDLCQEYTVSSGENFETVRTKIPSKLAAIQELNKMDGAYEPEKHEHKLTTSEEFLEAMKEITVPVVPTDLMNEDV